jgi:tetratricopeptide (TPR) repeat protein
MRHAVVVAPPSLVVPAQDLTGLLSVALAQGGRRPLVVATTTDLETDFDRALAGVGSSDDLVVYLASATTTGSEDVALHLGDEAGTTLALRVLSDTVLVREPATVLFVVEACHDGDPDDPLLAAEHIEAVTQALDARARGYGVLIGVRPQARVTDHPWPFTARILAALDHGDARNELGEVPASMVYERLRAADPGDVTGGSFTFLRGGAEMLLVDAPAVVHVASALRGGSSRPVALAPGTAVPIPLIAHAPPPSRATQPSLPPFEPLIDLADGARVRGAWKEAMAGYKAALMVAPQGDAEVRASIYSRIGEVKRAQGKPREAELNFEKALGADPGHRFSLDALVELAMEARETRRIIEWRRKRLAVLVEPGERVTELLAIARTHSEEPADPRAAAEALEEAHSIAPRDRVVFEELRASYEKLHRWPRVVEVIAELADITQNAAERGALRFIAADVALGRIRDEDRGLALLERALEDDPTLDRALDALVSVRTRHGEWNALDTAFANLVDRFARLGDVERAWDTCRKLGALRRDKTRNISGAIEAFTGAVSCKPGDVDSRAMLADMHLARGDDAQAVVEFERIAQYAPTRTSTYARLFALHQRAGRTDKAWLAGVALEELGAADMDQQLVVDQFRLDGPIRPSRSLDDVVWDELRAAGADEVIADVLRAVVDAAAAVRVEELRSAKRLVTLDPARRQSSASTVSAVRSFQWAAQVLAVDVPELYVLDSVPGGIGAAQVAVPTTALGPDVLRGLGARELAFLAGRHLTYYRREHYALVHYPTIAELASVFLAAVRLVLPDVPVPPHLAEAVARRRKLLARQVDVGALKRLEPAVRRLDARGGRLDFAAWIKSVELTAQRAGMLLCGDLRVATGRLRSETRHVGDLTFDQKRGDLLSFSASDRLARTRAMLSIDARTSVRPPPVSERQVG